MKGSFIFRVFALVFALSLAAYAVFKYERQLKEDEEKNIQSLLFKKQFSAKDVQKISFKRGEEEPLVLEKSPSKKWYLHSPAKDLADENKIQDLIDEFLNQKVILVESEDVQWKEYGLDSPFNVFVLETKDKQYKWGVGLEPNFDGQYYIKMENELYLGHSSWKSLTRLWANDYRNKALYESKDTVQKVLFQKKNNINVFNLKNNEWVWESKEKFPLSSHSVRKFLSSLRKELISEFSEKKKLKEIHQEKWSNPDLFVELALFQPQESVVEEKGIHNSQKLWWFKLNKLSNGKAEVIISDRDNIYFLDEAKASQILESDFRDHYAPFKWDLGQLSQIEMKLNNKEIVIKDNFVEFKNKANKTTSDQNEEYYWKVLKPQGYELDKDEWRIFFDWLGELKATAYHSSGWKKVNDEITLKDKDQNVLLNVQFSSSFKNQDKKDMIYVKTNRSKQIMSMNYDEVKKILSSNILKKIENEISKKDKDSEK